DYSPELQAISKRGKSTVSSADGGVVITGIKHSREDSVDSYINEPGRGQNRQSQAYQSQTSTSSYGGASSSGLDRGTSEAITNNGDNPFGDTERYDDDEEEEAEEPPNDGWTVRALYDYDRAEEDELEFKAGDVFVQLTTEDEMGWCKGRKDGRVGFYPKNYVARI
ncbi:unnamed protein product, partial [Candidula unifasciata]